MVSEIGLAHKNVEPGDITLDARYELSRLNGCCLTEPPSPNARQVHARGRRLAVFSCTSKLGYSDLFSSDG
jgi:hypothetical protein